MTSSSKRQPDWEVVAESDAATLEDRTDGAPFGRISKDSLSDLAYNEIRSVLMQGRLKPGEALVLRPLSAKLGISPTPVREALLRLVSEQALELDKRGRARVPMLDRQVFTEIRDLRVELEGMAAARAAEIASDEDIAALERIHGRMMEAEARKDTAAALKHNEEFHFTLCRLARMPVLFRVVESLWLRCGPFLNYIYEQELPKWPRHPHVLVLDGLKRRDGGMARAGIIEDIACFGSILLKWFDK